MRWHTWPFPTSARCPSTATIVVPVGHVGDAIPSPTCTPSHTSSPPMSSTLHVNDMTVIAPTVGVRPKVIVNCEMRLLLLLPLSLDYVPRLCS